MMFIIWIAIVSITPEIGWSTESISLTQKECQVLLALARSAIATFLDNGYVEKPDNKFLEDHPVFQMPRGVFVTLKKEGRLRGCIGEIYPQRPLFEGVQYCAIKSATQDYRFPPVTQDELKSLTLSISVLSLPSKIIAETGTHAALLRALIPGKDGIILVYNRNQSTFLPTVWNEIPEADEFLSHLCQKQGAPMDCWQNTNAVLYRYGTYDFSE